MDDIAGWLGRITWPIVSRVLAALGIGTVTYTGAEQALTGAMGHAKTALQGFGAEVLQIISMAGFFEYMSITSGGIMSGIAWMVMKRWTLAATGAAPA